MARRTYGVSEKATLVERLAWKRDGYAAELRRHKFLLDAFAATGGFSGRERADAASYWGPAADMYGDVTLGALDPSDQDEAALDTYLDRHPREDMPKFRRRVQVAHYSNYCEPVVDIRLSYMNRRPFSRTIADGSP